MKQKSELRSNDAASEKQWVRRSLTRARVQLGQAVTEALTPNASKPGDAAFGRMRELLQQDRANLVVQSSKPKAKPKSSPPPPPRAAYSVPSPAPSVPAAPAAAQTSGVAAVRTGVTPSTQHELAASTSKVMPIAPQHSAPAAAAPASPEEQAADPIRTLTMARLLAVQGYRKRALSIYDELLARDANDASLRAEAERLRG